MTCKSFIFFSLLATAWFTHASDMPPSPKPAQTEGVKKEQGTDDRSDQSQLTQRDTAGDFQPEDRPPSSGIGLQMEPAQVVYPSSKEIVENTVEDLEAIDLTPDQRNRLKELKQRRERAKSTPYVTPAKPVTRTMFINLNAGISPPTLRLSRGQLSTVVFSDANGQPWFITKVSANCTLFSTDACTPQEPNQQGQDGKGAPPTNFLTIEPKTSQAYGNITVSLNGLPTPVIFILTSGQDEVDLRVDAKIPGRNPDAQYSMTMANMPGIDNDLTSFLDGVTPKGANKLKVTGMDDVDAWEFNGFLYVRANADAQYPAYTKSARSTTGMSIYRFDSMADSVTFTAAGRAVTVFIEHTNNN